MFWLVLLFALETILEGLLCSGELTRSPRVRKVLIPTMVVFLMGFSIILSVLAWQVWIWVLPFSLYRGVNLVRLQINRLAMPQLRTVSVRAFGWLVPLQVAIIILAWIMSHFHIQKQLFDVTVAAQFFVAIVLLRATMHTWRHASLISTDEHLTDKELPSLSVLVPARNETEDLERCLQNLTASNYPKMEILVLDDCSATRRTPEIIRSFAHAGVRFLQGKVPDESRWLPKNFAYQQLAQEASGDLLLFCGVDALLEPGSMRQLVELLEARGKDMLSVMPLRRADAKRGSAMLQAMRYYWELCLPRGFFKRPPVLSTCWLIRRTALERMGGFEAISRSVSPEAPLARHTVVTNAYYFIRGDDELGIYSNKPAVEQYGTSVRVRYPQLHRRLELVALASVAEIVFLLGPLLGLLCVGSLPHAFAYAALWVVSLLFLFVTYGIVSVGTRLTNPWFGWLLMPVSFALDLYMLNVSMLKYEFGSVDWKGRNVCIPVMQMQPAPTAANVQSPKP